jgi:hypothetical protein
MTASGAGASAARSGAATATSARCRRDRPCRDRSPRASAADRSAARGRPPVAHRPLAIRRAHRVGRQRRRRRIGAFGVGIGIVEAQGVESSATPRAKASGGERQDDVDRRGPRFGGQRQHRPPATTS